MRATQGCDASRAGIAHTTNLELERCGLTAVAAAGEVIDCLCDTAERWRRHWKKWSAGELGTRGGIRGEAVQGAGRGVVHLSCFRLQYAEEAAYLLCVIQSGCRGSGSRCQRVPHLGCTLRIFCLGRQALQRLSSGRPIPAGVCPPPALHLQAPAVCSPHCRCCGGGGCPCSKAPASWPAAACTALAARHQQQQQQQLLMQLVVKQQ